MYKKPYDGCAQLSLKMSYNVVNIMMILTLSQNHSVTTCHLQALSRDALDKLDTVKMKANLEKTHYQDMEEPVPDQFTEKLEQINTLEDSIKVCC